MESILPTRPAKGIDSGNNRLNPITFQPLNYAKSRQKEKELANGLDPNASQPMIIDIRKTRRRIEDALRKTATEEKILYIAQLLGVKVEEGKAEMM